MTNKEAIKWLKIEASYIEEDVGHGKEILEAYDMAIKALEREPCEDCVSRQAAIDAVHKEFDECLVWDESGEKTANEVEQILEDLPPVTPQPKVSEWIEKEVIDDKVIEEWQSARCSVCDKYHTTPYMYYFNNYKFCPNCGAKMEVSE